MNVLALLALALLASLAGCARPRPSVIGPVAGPGGRANASPEVNSLNYLNSGRGPGTLLIRYFDGRAERRLFTVGTILQTQSTGPLWLLPEGSLYFSGERTGKRLWRVVSTNNITIGVDGTVLLVENPQPAGALPRTEWVYVVDSRRASEVVKVEPANGQSVALKKGEYAECVIDGTGRATVTVAPIPNDPANPRRRFVDDMLAKAQQLGL